MLITHFSCKVCLMYVIFKYSLKFNGNIRMELMITRQEIFTDL
jgi:hypothetical protein